MEARKPDDAPRHDMHMTCAIRCNTVMDVLLRTCMCATRTAMTVLRMPVHPVSPKRGPQGKKGVSNCRYQALICPQPLKR